MSQPRVACIVTCFNLGEYLPDALESIRRQTFRDIEICVVDDGSTDERTLSVLDACGPDVRVLRTPNRGLSAARNHGVAHTRAELVCAVDADDILGPTLLERSVERLDADPDLAFVSHWLEAFGDESWSWYPVACGFPDLLEANTVNGAALVRRAVVDAVGGWDETMREGCEDWDFWISAVERGYRGEIIPEVLFHYRRRPGSMSRTRFAHDGLSRLYGRLVAKHAATFEHHLAELWARRQVATARDRWHADLLDHEYAFELAPALVHARDDAATAAHRAAAARSEEERRRQLERVTGERDRLADEAAAAARDARALRASLSWRLMAPARALGRLAPGLRRGRR